MGPSSVVSLVRHLRDVVATGWSDGDVPVYNESEDRFEPGAGGGGGSFDPDDPLDYLTMVDSDGVSWTVTVGTDGALTTTSFGALLTESGDQLNTESGDVLILES